MWIFKSHAISGPYLFKTSMDKKLTSYLHFLDHSNRLEPSDLKEKANEIINHFEPRHLGNNRFAPATYLLDYTTKKYLYVEESCFNILGYTAKWFLETGVDEYISKWHPSDLKVMDTKIFPENIQFLQSIPFNQYQDIIFSYNYRMINPLNDYITVLQRFSYIPGNLPNVPAGAIGVAFDITHFKNDTSIIHTIEKVKEIGGKRVNELLYKKIHAVEEPDVLPISPREQQILQYMAEGMSSKQIACTLFLSVHTVNNHRKNMLQKTGCKTSSELLNYALKHGHL